LQRHFQPGEAAAILAPVPIVGPALGASAKSTHGKGYEYFRIVLDDKRDPLCGKREYLGDKPVEKLFDAFIAPLTLAAYRSLVKTSQLGACIGGSVDLPFSFGMVRMSASPEQLPRSRFWVGEVRSGGAMFTVTLMLFGEAVLTVVCTHFP
jgi:hypothetical protein